MTQHVTFVVGCCHKVTVLTENYRPRRFQRNRLCICGDRAVYFLKAINSPDPSLELQPRAVLKTSGSVFPIYVYIWHIFIDARILDSY